ncbi:hypothetical protein EMCRGX_G028006 [Ephydatia muelleri]
MRYLLALCFIYCSTSVQQNVNSPQSDRRSDIKSIVINIFQGHSSQSKIRNRIKHIAKVKKVRSQHTSAKATTATGVKKARRADTNVLCVKFNKLTEPSNVHAGDAVTCANSNCTAVLSFVSKVTTPVADGSDQGNKVWVCEFCGTKNSIDIVPEEIPTSPDTTYLLAPPPAVESDKSGHGGDVDETLAIFCIDVSGSMCVTTEVPGKFKVKGADTKPGLESLDTEGSDQHLPRERRDITYVSRLQCVKDAVDKQLLALTKEHPNRRAILITFSDEVTVIGDAKSDAVTIAGDKLSSLEMLVKIGNEVPLPGAIKLAYEDLKKKLFSLEEGGQTALGPALLVATTIAGKVSGSKVIICTDGLANKGVGNLEVEKGKEAKSAQTFYEDVGTVSLEKCVTVSLLTIQGTNCRTANLGQVADKTRGECISVDPLSITKEVSDILSNPVIATNVKAKIILHKKLYFRTEDSSDNILTVSVGNATLDTEFLYEYGARTVKAKAEETNSGGASPKMEDASPEAPPIDIDGKPHLPFQVQIEYTRLDGAKCMRVLTDVKPVTFDRAVAEKGIDLAILGKHIASTTARLAMEGEFTQARVSAIVGQRLIEKNSHANPKARSQYNALMTDIIPLENALRDRQEEERREYGGNLSDCGNNTASDDESERIIVPVKKVKAKKKKVQRRTDMSDSLANYCYQVKENPSTTYGKPSESDSD